MPININTCKSFENIQKIEGFMRNRQWEHFCVKMSWLYSRVLSNWTTPFFLLLPLYYIVITFGIVYNVCWRWLFMEILNSLLFLCCLISCRYCVLSTLIPRKCNPNKLISRPWILMVWCMKVVYEVWWLRLYGKSTVKIRKCILFQSIKQVSQLVRYWSVPYNAPTYTYL